MLVNSININQSSSNVSYETKFIKAKDGVEKGFPRPIVFVFRKEVRKQQGHQ